MRVYVNLTVADYSWEDDRIESKKDKKGIRHLVRKVSDKISKYISFDKDAIFKDPNWPHLWN